MDLMEDASSVERMLIEKAAQSRSPLSGTLELLPLCNMNCDMCYVRLSREEMERQGRLRTAQEWTDLARQMRDAGVLFLMLTGGEPLMFPGFKDVYLSLIRMGIIVTINTNGTLIDEQWAAFFGAHKPRRINITLYGADARAYEELCHYPGGFEKAIRAVRLLRAQGVDVKINGSMTKANVADGEKICRIARELDAAVHVDTYMYPATRERGKPYNEQARLNPEEAARARAAMMLAELGVEKYTGAAMNMLYKATHTPPGEETPGGMKCQAGRSAFSVNWRGMMCPCVMLPELSAPVFETGFARGWERLTHMVDQIRLSPACSRCPLRTVCTTCAACALYESGRYDGVPEYACRYTMETLNCLAADLHKRMKAEEEKHG